MIKVLLLIVQSIIVMVKYWIFFFHQILDVLESVDLIENILHECEECEVKSAGWSTTFRNQQR